MNAVRTPGFPRLAARLAEIQATLEELRLDGWLLYDFHARNAVAGQLLGLGELTRRYFVLVPARGEPCALVHGIEEGPWEAWPWPRRRYVGWRELEEGLRGLVGGKRVAMEFSPGDAVPTLDLVPAGVVELVRAAGADVVASGDLVTRFCARWTAEGLASHRRAARVLEATAEAAFARLAATVGSGVVVTEGELRSWVLDRLAAAGCGVAADCIVAGGPNAANPHYEPGPRGAPLRPGQLVLLDLWGKESEDAIVADQTWMAYLGAALPPRAAEVWSAVRDARDAAVEFLRRRWEERRPVRGFEVDDVARAVVAARGYGAAFIHRTGHAIDQATHGVGPNLDNLETRELRYLVPGIGFSIEPGIYLPGELGVRSEINVYLGDDGPEVSPPAPQRDVPCLLPQ